MRRPSRCDHDVGSLERRDAAPGVLSRRGFAALLLQGVVSFAPRLQAAETAARDRGLGGTGAAPGDPAERLGQDRGIGGTGVIGTIRRFGSIVVNDMRVGFPARVRVTIDGAPASVRRLRIGHVVRVLAHRRRGRLDTRNIVVESEVVGPVDAAGSHDLVVLGQRIELEAGVPPSPHRRGDRVAVSGLRRLDGTIVASLVEGRAPGPLRLSGPVARGADGDLTIGTLRIAGLSPTLVGRRVTLTGRRIGERFEPDAMTIEPRVPFPDAERLSIEGYVGRLDQGLRFGSGLDLALGEATATTTTQLSGGTGTRAVVTARQGRAGLEVETVRVERDHGSAGHGRDARGPDHGPGHPAGDDPSRAQGGPRSGGRGPGSGAPGGRGDGPGGRGNGQHGGNGNGR